jgi:hypothetical protein
MSKIGTVLLFPEPEVCPEIARPAKQVHVSETEAEKIEHRTSYSARTGYEVQGYTTA